MIQCPLTTGLSAPEHHDVVVPATYDLSEEVFYKEVPYRFPHILHVANMSPMTHEALSSNAIGLTERSSKLLSILLFKSSIHRDIFFGYITKLHKVIKLCLLES